MLDIVVHCLAKKLLNRFVDLLKRSVTSLWSTSVGGISGILLPFTNVSKMSQYVLRAVGSFSLLARSSCYFNSEKNIGFDISSVRAFKDL